MHGCVTQQVEQLLMKVTLPYQPVSRLQQYRPPETGRSALAGLDAKTNGAPHDQPHHPHPPPSI